MNLPSLIYQIIDHTADLGIIVKDTDENGGHCFIFALFSTLQLRPLGYIGNGESSQLLNLPGSGPQLNSP